MWWRRAGCSRCTLLSVWAVVVTVGLISYIPIMFVITPAPPFDWGPEVDRNISRYVRPFSNTTLLQPAAHSADNCRPFLLIMVSSAVRNFPARNAIRETWASPSALPKDTLVYFLTGRADNYSLSDNLAAENEVHGDLVQQDFTDVYSNLTLKTVMMLKWSTSQCAPRYILKTDEDMYINVPKLVTYLEQSGHADIIVGAVICDAAPMRDKYSKYYSPQHMFTLRRFPVYVSGTAYVLGGGIAPRLYRTALGTRLYHLEDVFLTGICAAQLDITPTDHPGFSYFPRGSDPCEYYRVVSGHEMKPGALRDIWWRMHEPGVRERCAAMPTPKPRTVVKCRRPPATVFKRWQSL